MEWGIEWGRGAGTPQGDGNVCQAGDNARQLAAWEIAREKVEAARVLQRTGRGRVCAGASVEGTEVVREGAEVVPRAPITMPYCTNFCTLRRHTSTLQGVQKAASSSALVCAEPAALEQARTYCTSARLSYLSEHDF